MAAEFPASEHEIAARAVIAQAGAALAARRSDIPATFVAQLYARVVADDVLCYAAGDLAELAERAFDFLKERQPGAPKIRCETVALKELGERKSVTVIEIVNDDMPFLVDSVMGEIGERRLTVQLVAHPVFGVQRDGAKLVALGANAAGGARESFIHIHLEPIADEAARADVVRALAGVLGEVRLAVARLARHARARQQRGRRSEDQSAAAAGGRDRRGGSVLAMAIGRQFHLPRRAQLHFRRQ